MTYDYIVVGAGAAGCVLASRLAAEPGVTVLLVEHGGAGRNPLLAVPRAFYFTLRSKKYTHRYETLPVVGGGPEVWTRGRGLGGSTLVNGMMYVRGSSADFAALESAGNRGWGTEAFLGAYRGIEAKLGVTIPSQEDEVTEALFAAASATGLRRTADFNVDDDDRIGSTPATIRHGRRTSAAAFIEPRGRQLTVMTGARVDRVLLDGTRAVGVAVTRRGRTSAVRARREVVIAAGTIESPLLLERSGIGHPDVLRAAGVRPVVDSPHVGERVIEQRAVSLQVKFRDRHGATERLNTWPRQLREGARYLVTRRGPIATSGYDVVSAFRSHPDAKRPDAQGVWVPMALDETSADMRLAPYSGLLFTGYALRPTSASSIHLGASADAPPVITPRFLEHEAERRTTGAILDHARQVVATSPLADLIEREVFPGSTVSSPEDVIDYARASGAGIYHAVGSCAMGPDDGDVVDAELRVRGVDGLRMADASVLPFQISGNSAAPVMAVGWIAADLILP